jgi:hypothetical protein
MLNIFKKQEGLLNVYRQMIFFGIYLLAAYSFVCYLGSTNSLKYKSLEDCILTKATDARLYQVALTACTKEIEAEFVSLQESNAFGFRYQDALNEGYTKIRIYEFLNQHKSAFFLSSETFNIGLYRINSYPESRLINALKGALIFGTIGWLIGIIFTYLSIKLKRKPDDLKDSP